MQLDADWSHWGAQAWTGTTLTLEICLLLFLFKSLLVALELLLVTITITSTITSPDVCKSLPRHCHFLKFCVTGIAKSKSNYKNYR